MKAGYQMDLLPSFKISLAEILDVEIEEIAVNFVLDESNWDSLAVISTAMLIETVYNKTVDGDELIGCNNVGELISQIDKSKV